MRAKKYEAKDRQLYAIMRLFKSADLTDEERLRLSMYFAYYNEDALAASILKRRAETLSASEDLIFYYLNLTIADDKYVSDPSYRLIILNAIDANRGRFCKMFNALDNGGISFQLLENPYLQKAYCKHCQQTML